MKVTIKKRYILCRGGEETVLPYSEVKDFVNGFAIVELNGKYGFIDETVKEIVSPKYDYVSNFKNGFAGVGLNGKDGFIDETGKEIAPLKYDYISDFKNGFVVVGLNGEYGCIDETGKETVPPKNYLDYLDDSDNYSDVILF